MAKCKKCGYDPDQVSTTLVKQTMNRFKDPKSGKVIIVNSEEKSITIKGIVYQLESTVGVAKPVETPPKAPAKPVEASTK